MKNPISWIKETVDVSRIFGDTGSLFGLRSLWRAIGGGFYPDRPVMDKTLVDMNLARSLYRNDDPATNLGAGFARPIIDLTAEFVGIPYASSSDESRDNFLNECLHDYWTSQIQEVIRNACRDSRTIVRLEQPLLTNKMVTSNERDHCKLALLDPERVKIMRDPMDFDTIIKAYVTHYVEFDESDDPNVNNPNSGGIPKFVEHTIIETITPESFSYFDKSENIQLDSWGSWNPWGFVPLLEVWNEYDSTLSGGQSDLESVYPFIKAFHEVLYQALQAHKYHSTPKIRFLLKDVSSFIENNWPGTLDDAGKPKAGAKIEWRGKEVLFMGAEEDAGFIEAKSVLGDSKTLLEFLIDCISIASETPEWAFMRVEGGTSQGAMNSQALPFEKKVTRKRRMFQDSIQVLLKMVLVVNGKQPERVTLSWPVIHIDDLVAKGQAIQQIIMGMDVATQHEWISDPSVVKILASIFPEMKAPEEEMALAKTNVVPLPPQAPASGTQALPPGKSNGRGSKKSASKALATTKPSRS